MKKILTVAIVLFAITGIALFGGGGTQSGSAQTTGGPVRLTLAVQEDLKIGDYKNTVQTRLIEQATNTDLEFIVLPSIDYGTRINLMVMSGGRELPDIITTNGSFGDSMIYQWAREGAILPLKKYYDDPVISANIRSAQTRANYNFLPEITSPDGEIYGIPWLLQFEGNEVPGKFWYYKPWVDKLNLSLPTNTEEFRTFLRAIVTQDPNGNGIADEIGFGGVLQNLTGAGGVNFWFNYLMNPFVYVGEGLLNIENGKLSVPYNTEGWKTGLKYIRSLIEEGLIPVENLTQDSNQLIALANSNPLRVFSYVTYSGNLPTNTEIRDQTFIMPPLKGVNGTQYSTIIPAVAQIYFLITSNCKNPEAAFRVGDIMMREDISITNRFGERGVQWDYVQDIPNAASRFAQYLEGWTPKIITYDDVTYWSTPNVVSNAGWNQRGSGFLAYDIVHGRFLPQETMTEGYQTNLSSAISMYTKAAFGPKEVLGKLIYTDDEILVIGDIRSTLNSYVLEMTSNFLAGNRNIDASWDSYITELNNIGLTRMLSTMQIAYDRMHK